MRSSSLARSSEPVNFDIELRGFVSQTFEQRPRTHGAGAGRLTYYRELAGHQTERAHHDGTSLVMYGETTTIQGLGSTILSNSLTMAQWNYPLTLAGTNITGGEHFSLVHPIGNVFVSYIGDPPNPFSIDRFIKELLGALAQDPVMDGFKHAAEPILERAFAREPGKLGHWFQNLITAHPDSSKIADILRLLARFKPYNAEWRQQIAQVALGSRSPDIRDAAIQAVESWAEPGLTELLRSHTETTPWLADYAAQVVRDLTE